MTNLRKLSEAKWADTPGTPEYIRAATECYWQFRSGSLIPRSEYERVLALLAEAREALNDAALMLEAAAEDMAAGRADEGGATALREQEDAARATLSRIDDVLAAEPEARG